MADNALVVNTGTALTMASDDISSVHYPRVKVALGGNGTFLNDFTGTMAEVSNLAKGTITKLEGGTLAGLSSGTINVGTVVNNGGTVAVLTAGTVSTVGLGHPNAFGTVVTSGTNVMGTIKPAVGGSAIYVTDLIISVGSASVVQIGNGTATNMIVGSLSFAANGGLAMSFRTPLFTSAGSALVYIQSANGPLSITAMGYVT